MGVSRTNYTHQLVHRVRSPRLNPTHDHAHSPSDNVVPLTPLVGTLYDPPLILLEQLYLPVSPRTKLRIEVQHLRVDANLVRVAKHLKSDR